MAETAEVKMNITTVSLFLGRFYLDRAGQAVVRMVDAEFEYTYEYQVTFIVHLNI